MELQLKTKFNSVKSIQTHGITYTNLFRRTVLRTLSISLPKFLFQVIPLCFTGLFLICFLKRFMVGRNPLDSYCSFLCECKWLKCFALRYRKSSNYPPWGLCILWVFTWGLIWGKGILKIFLVVGHIPVEIFLLVNYVFDTTHTSNRIFFTGQANLHLLMTAFIS